MRKVKIKTWKQMKKEFGLDKFEDIRECKFVKEEDENKKYNIYKNTIEDKQVLVIVFLKEDRDVKVANIIIRKYESKPLNYTGCELGTNAFIFVETDREDTGEIFTIEEMRLIELFKITYSDELWEQYCLTYAKNELNLKRAIEINI